VALAPSALAGRLRGVIAFPVTPFLRNADRDLDLPSFEAHIERLAGSGVAALVVAGGTGEFFSLTPTEIGRLVRAAVGIAGGRLPILAGVGLGPSLGAELARDARHAGADGVLALPPAYPNPDASGLVAYYRAIARAVPDLAVVPYSRGGALVTPAVLEGLATTPNVVAFKDGQGDVRMFQRNRAALGDRYVWLAGAGDDIVGAYAAAGAEGYTSSLACFDPPLSLRLWELASAGRLAELDRLHAERVAPWYALRARRAGYEVSVMKAGMEAFGMTAGPVRPPLADVADEERAEIQALAGRIGLFAAAVQPVPST
jgi:5-dehydro-4-deoxyglucarate dehydratase